MIILDTAAGMLLALTVYQYIVTPVLNWLGDIIANSRNKPKRQDPLI